MNRRHFLNTTVLGGFVYPLEKNFGLSKEPSRSFKGKILKAVKFGGKVNPDRMRKLKDLGFDGVEGSGPGLNGKEMIEACEKFDLPMHGLVYNKHWKVRLSSPDPETQEAGRVGLEDAMQESKAVGGSSVLLVPGAVKGKNENHDDVWTRSIVQIRKCIPLAKELKIHILIETVWNGFCLKPELFRDYIDEINSPWVQAYYDIGNMQKYGPSHQWIRVLGKRIIKLDVKDWGEKNGFCPLGKGDVNWNKVRSELEQINFSGWATREGSDGGDEETAKLMNELLDL
jgi:L-ribulose-5-phosphate 3-epimerase